MRIIFYFLFFTIAAFSCRQIADETLDYNSLNVDTNKISVFKYDSTFSVLPKFSEPLALTNDDIKLADSLLVDEVERFNQTDSKKLYEAFNKQVLVDSFTIDLSKYKRQYFPYKDNNGQRVVQVICFSKPFAEWRYKIYSGRIHEGLYRFSLRINLSEKRADKFSTGGFG